MPVVCYKPFQITVHPSDTTLSLIHYYQCASDPDLDLVSGNDLTPQQAGFMGPFPPPTIVAGKIGPGFQTDNSGSRPPGWVMENNPGGSDWNFSNKDWSFRVWHNNSDPTASQGLIMGTSDWGVIANAGAYVFFVYTETTGALQSVTASPVSAGWHHIVGWRQNGVGLFLEVDFTAPHSGGGSAQMRFSAGSEFVVNGSFNATNCIIDEVAMWNGILTQAQILNDYNGGAGRTYPDVPGI